MNAILDTSADRDVRGGDFAPPHATHTWKSLLRREYWEHRGGFVLAPVITGIVASVLLLLAALAATIVGQRHDISMARGADATDAERVVGLVGDGALIGGIGLAMTVLTFVVFFYALGCLYDDRRDRSILFWKSLPISDTQMVLSKAAWALVLAPLVALLIGCAIGLVFWLITALTTTVNGVPGTRGILFDSHPFRILGNVLALFPVQVLWSLPAVGWLMLCSAWSRRVPVLWAVMLPILTCTIISFMGIFPGISIPHGKLWYVVAYRGLLSVVPGSWLPPLQIDQHQLENAQSIPNVLNIQLGLQALSHADIWIGTAIGIALIFAAIRLRRWRDEG